MKVNKIAHYFQHLLDAVQDKRGNARVHPRVRNWGRNTFSGAGWAPGPVLQATLVQQTRICLPQITPEPWIVIEVEQSGRSAVSLHYLIIRLDDYYYSLILACHHCTSDRLSW
jgi:hypothetical protein